jgi:hypothetical protein
MSRTVLAITAIIGSGCIYYLLLDPVQRAQFFLTRSLGKKLFPRLDPYQRQRKITIFVGTILATLVTAVIIIFVFNRLGRR